MSEDNTDRLERPSSRLRAQTRQATRGPAREGERLLRRRSRVHDEFYIDQALIPEGMSWEWKCESCYGMPNTEHLTRMRENHWKPVIGLAVAHMVPEDALEKPVRQKGMILMERPAYLTDEAREEDFDNARMAVSKKEKQLGETPQGHMTRNHPSARDAARLNKSRGPLVIEDAE